MQWNVTGIALISATLAVYGQGAKDMQVVEDRVTMAAPAIPVAGAPMHTMQFMNVGAKAVKGAPYSAETVNETVQVLPDGNRIVNKNSSKTYRDSEGRTRQENSFGPMGMWVPDNSAPSMTTIDDPVSGEHYILDNNRKTATKAFVRVSLSSDGAKMEKEVSVTMSRSGSGAGAGMVAHTLTAGEPVSDVLIQGPAVMGVAGTKARMSFSGTASMSSIVSDNAKKEDLGTRIIEGVECTGTKMTFTTPAGQIGNEREIQTVTERWYSSKLQTDVLRKHSDPRFGETTYRLTNIIQSEQPRSLFDVPADYKLEEAPSPHIMMRKMDSKNE